MRQQVILCDVGGYTERLRAMKDAHPYVVGVVPHDKPCAGFTPIVIPDEWLPQRLIHSPSDPLDEYSRRCWWGCGKLALAAVMLLNLKADFFWMIESDCVAEQFRWKSLIQNHRDNPTDCLVVSKMTRGRNPLNGFWAHPGTEPWMNLQHIGAIYRLSRAAVQVCLDTAVEYREAFGELSIGGAVERAGLSVDFINSRDVTHLNCQTVKGGGIPAINRDLICHPIKINSYEFLPS